MLIWLIPCCLLGSFFLFFLITAVYIFCRINNKRYNGNAHVRYLTASDFPLLAAEPLAFPSDRGQMLRGYLYRNSENEHPKALLLFAHGFGAGHLAYTTEIVTLANAGYWVLAYDATGCGASDGKNMRGFDQGVIDLRSAVHYAKSIERFSGLKMMLVGHSWGAFCVMNALPEEDVCGAVAICGFISGAKVLSQNTVGQAGPLRYPVEWFLRLLNFMRFGKASNRDSLRSLTKTKKPVYLIYGTADTVVTYKWNGAVMIGRFSGADTVRVRKCEGKGHNPYLSFAAEKYMNETFAKIARMKKKDRAKAMAMYEDIDYGKMTEEDPEIMRSVIEFCDTVVV